MKLYDTRRAPNPRRVRWFMAEKGIDAIEIVETDLMRGEHKTGDYLDRAGYAHVPALTLDDGTTITESVAICRYLEALHPEPNLFGRTPKEQAVVEMWIRRAEFLVGYPLMMAARHSHPALAVLETQWPEVAAYNKQSGEGALAYFDARLADHEWIAGERISLADGIVMIGLDFARLAKVSAPEELKNLGRWLAAMKARPSAAAGT